MSAITATKDTRRQEGVVISLPQAAVSILEGAFVSINSSGYATNATDASGDVFVGVCHKASDNSAGNAGDVEVQVITDGVHDAVAGFSAAATNVGDLCYVSDNQTVDLAANLTNDVLVGRIVAVESASKVRVWLDRRV